MAHSYVQETLVHMISVKIVYGHTVFSRLLPMATTVDFKSLSQSIIF